jgi:hypothetical protein
LIAIDWQGTTSVIAEIKGFDAGYCSVPRRQMALQEMANTTIGQDTLELMSSKITKDNWQIKLHPFPNYSTEENKTVTHGTSNNGTREVSLYGFFELGKTFVHEVNHIEVKEESFVASIKETFKDYPIILDIIKAIEGIFSEKTDPEQAKQFVEDFSKKYFNIEHLKKPQQLVFTDIFENKLTPEERVYFGFDNSVFVFESKEKFYEHLLAVEEGMNRVSVKNKEGESDQENSKKRDKKEDSKDIYMPLDIAKIKSVINKLTPEQKKEYTAVKNNIQIKKVFDGMKSYQNKTSDEKKEELSCRVLETIYELEKNFNITKTIATNEYKSVMQNIEPKIYKNSQIRL